MAVIFYVFLCLTPTFAYGWLNLIEPRSVCYRPWGCFSLRTPFTNTVYLPQAPDELGVRVFHHTRGASRRLLDHRTRGLYDVTKETRVILHGYMDNTNRAWISDLTRRLLDRTDQNVLVVDWERGADSINYFQVVANTRLVAKMIAAELRKLIRMGAQPGSFHLIGLSLGAHIAGYVGSEINGIGRITGLDPAGPGFENTSPEVRLDPSDAVFVDVIHTNAVPFSEMGLGYVNPCGTVDFYPNGGRLQPGCYRSVWGRFVGFVRGSELISVLGCDHVRAALLFIDSISSTCQMPALPCQYPHVQQPFSCNVTSATQPCDECVTMGYDVNKTATGVYFLRTRSWTPFCIE